MGQPSKGTAANRRAALAHNDKENEDPRYTLRPRADRREYRHQTEEQSRREIDEASPTSILTARGIDVRKRALQDVTRQMNNTKSPANRTKAARVVPTDLSMKAKDATRQKKSKK